MRIGPAANVARLNVNEIVTALWSFANAQGLLTDDITERTGGAGVTIGGVRFDNIAIDLLGLASAANRVLGSDVLGDVDERFRLHAGGIMQWGDGAGARDTTLQRDAANELGTPDDFNVGGVLDLGGDIQLDSRDILLAVGVNNDVATGTVPIQRTNPTGASSITGLAGGVADRVLVVFHRSGGGTISLNHQDVGSAAANRIICPNALAVNLDPGDSAILWYDGAVSRWQIISISV